ncbi:MAG: hypothetical protein JSS24_09130 [Proteobacteria bacterium]|nr:hypothetical protein [Pseudomonadota bacterium]
MKRFSACILSAMLGAGLPVSVLSARVPVVLIEASIESSAAELSLPGTLGGIIVVRGCSACSAQTFYFAKDPLLMLAGKKVDLQQMAAALRRAGTAPVTVHYRRSDSAVTRIVLTTEAQLETAQ